MKMNLKHFIKFIKRSKLKYALHSNSYGLIAKINLSNKMTSAQMNKRQQVALFKFQPIVYQ